jgi:hypothetical protein
LGWLSWVARTLDNAKFLLAFPVATGLVAALLLASIGYVVALLVMARGVAAVPGGAGMVVGFALVFQATLALRPSILNPDVFFYIAWGHLGGVAGLNPYQATLDLLVGVPALEWLPPMWLAATSPYGALWTTVSVAIAPALASLAIFEQVLAYRLLINAAQIANLALVWWLLGRTLPGPTALGARVTAFAVFAWNPLLLLEVAGNAHNDGLMLTLLLVSLVPLASMRSRANAVRSTPPGLATNLRWLTFWVVLSLSVLVKYATGLVGVVAAVAWARELSSWRARALWLSGALVVAGLVTYLLYAPWSVGPHVLATAVQEVSGKYVVHSVPGLIQEELSDALINLADLAPDAANQLARVWVGSATLLMFGIYLAWELRRLWLAADQRPVLQAVLTTSARAYMVLLLLVVTQLHSWYFTWPLALVTLLGWQHALTRVVVGYTVMAVGIEYLALFDWYATAPWAVRVGLRALYLGLPLLTLFATRERLRSPRLYATRLARGLPHDGLLLRVPEPTKPSGSQPAP